MNRASGYGSDEVVLCMLLLVHEGSEEQRVAKREVEESGNNVRAGR